MKGKVTLSPKASRFRDGWHLDELSMLIEIPNGDKHPVYHQGPLRSVSARMAGNGIMINSEISDSAVATWPKSEEEVNLPDGLKNTIEKYAVAKEDLKKAVKAYMKSKWKEVEPKLIKANEIKGIKPASSCYYPLILTE